MDVDSEKSKESSQNQDELSKEYSEIVNVPTRKSVSSKLRMRAISSPATQISIHILRQSFIQFRKYYTIQIMTIDML